jgi:flagellar FliJ protein
MKFHFSLQSLLNWKKNLEECSQMRLAKKKVQLQAQEEEITELMTRRRENEERLHDKVVRGIGLGEYLLHKEFDEDSFEDLLNKESQKERTQVEIEGERKVLTGFMKERKMLERLKEKGLKTFTGKMEKLEQKNADEMVLQRRCSTGKRELR